MDSRVFKARHGNVENVQELVKPHDGQLTPPRLQQGRLNVLEHPQEANQQVLCALGRQGVPLARTNSPASVSSTVPERRRRPRVGDDRDGAVQHARRAADAAARRRLIGVFHAAAAGALHLRDGVEDDADEREVQDGDAGLGGRGVDDVVFPGALLTRSLLLGRVPHVHVVAPQQVPDGLDCPVDTRTNMN